MVWVSDRFDDEEKSFAEQEGWDDEPDICEGCGRDMNSYDGDPCPMCCPHSFAPGSEQCDFCPYSDECQ